MFSFSEFAYGEEYMRLIRSEEDKKNNEIKK